MPTTDPGSDLIFSTDDEINGATANTIRYATLPLRTRRHLLSSELQRRYIDEIGDCMGIMPPELVITASSNKEKQKIKAQIFKPTATEIFAPNSQRTIVVMPSVRTRSWHNLKISKRTLISYKPGDAKNITQSSLYRPMTKKEVLNKEELNIELSLKKNIWTSIHQPDKTSLGFDRTRSLSWMAPNSLRDKSKTAEQNIYGDLNFLKPSICNNSKKADNKVLLSAYNRKLLEWKILSENPNNSPYTQEEKKTDIKDPTNYTVKNVGNINVACMKNYSKNTYNEISSVRKPKRKIKNSKILAKLSKSRSNILTSHHSPIKRPLNQNKSHARSYKLKTGGLVAAAVQTEVSGGRTAAKTNNKSKFKQNKLQDFNSYKTKSPKIAVPQIPFTHNNYNNNARNNLALTAAATSVVQKAKTKLKNNKKLPVCAKQKPQLSNPNDSSTK